MEASLNLYFFNSTIFNKNIGDRKYSNLPVCKCSEQNMLYFGLRKYDKLRFYRW
jgi:hypothetical protein